MKNYADAGNRKARRALYVADDFDRLLSTILVGNNVVNMASASIATVVATAMFGASGAAVATVVMTVLVLIFGEILPKTLAKENSAAVPAAVKASPTPQAQASPSAEPDGKTKTAPKTDKSKSGNRILFCKDQGACSAACQGAGGTAVRH